MRAFVYVLCLATWAPALGQSPAVERLIEAMALQDPWDRMAATSHSLLALDPTHTQEAIERVIGSPPSAEGDEILPLLWRRLGKQMGLDAIEQAAEAGPLPFQRRLAMIAAMQGWTESEPEAAWAWAVARFQADPRRRGDVLPTHEITVVGTALLKMGRSDIVKSLITRPEDFGEPLRIHSLIRVAGRFAREQVLEWTAELPEGNTRIWLLNSVAEAQTDSDPLAAIAWVRTLDEQSRRTLLPGILHQWRYGARVGFFGNWYPGPKDPEVIEWLLAQPPEPGLDSALKDLGLNARLDPEIREQLLARIADPETRDSAYGTQAERALSSRPGRLADPAEAAAWAVRLVNPATRAEKLGRIVHAWEAHDPEAAWDFIANSPHLTGEERQWLGRTLELRR